MAATVKEFEEPEIRDDVVPNDSEEEGEDLINDGENGDDDEDDLSEEEEDDAAEEAKIREGFIVDDDDDLGRRKRRHKKRKRDGEKPPAVDDALDEDDLELLLENLGAKPAPSASKFKRLKRAQAAPEGQETRGNASRDRDGLNDMFSDDDDNDDEVAEIAEERPGRDQHNILDEFEDFIEDDEFSDDDERERRAVQQRVRAKKAGPRLDTSKLSSVDRESLLQLFEVFGSGAEYEWALEAQEIEDDRNAESVEPTALDEVFEHLELKERMLTEEDNLIRIIDVPERYQRFRANLNYIDLDGDELAAEQEWVSNIIFLEKQGVLAPTLEAPLREAVAKVVEFVSKDAYEVPFVWAHRRDFLLHLEEVIKEDGAVSNVVHKLLFEDDLWRIVQLDIEYHLLYEKRLNTEKLIETLGLDDDLVKDVRALESMVAVQDLHDYLNFTYLAEIRGLAPAEEEKGMKKHSKYGVFERIRGNVLYDAVEAYGLLAKAFGENVQDQSSKNFDVPYRIHATDDALELPEDLIEKLVEDDEVLFKDPKNAIDAVRRTYAEEIFHNPKIRYEVRHTYKNFASVSVALTDKGRATIDSHSPYADIKYAVNRLPADLVQQPDVLLRMLEAEAAGLVVVKVETRDYSMWYRLVFGCLKLDGSSDISEAWNRERDTALTLAFKKLTAMVALNTKEDLRRECERLVQAEVRHGFLAKVDQAPFTPFGYDKGTRPNVLALLFGKGDYSSAVVGVFVRDNGRVDEYFKSDTNPASGRENGDKFALQLKEFFDKTLRGRRPDVIAVSGYTASSKRLFDAVTNFVSAESITSSEEGGSNPPLIPVIWGQDETARLYQGLERALQELSDKPTLVKYCVGVARYVQSPLLEYVALGEAILSLLFHTHQKLILADLVADAVESVLVDVVNMVGVEINDALRDPYVAQLLPYVSGLGPRKASGLVRNITAKLGTLTARSDLIEHELLTATVFINCLSFLSIGESRDGEGDLLDATRIHPEDYDLARKMAADALDLDEEDMAHVDETGGIIHQLMQDGVSKVDDLNLTAYGRELETKFGKKKYATLQSIKEELVNNYEELRRLYHVMDAADVFHMLTGETVETFQKGTLVPVTVDRVGRGFREDGRVKFLKVSTVLFILGSVEEQQLPRNTDFQQGQVVQAVVEGVSYDTFTADFSLLEADIVRASASKFAKESGKWDYEAEEADRGREEAKERAQNAKTRTVQHPLFRQFGARQAEEYLAPQAVGDCVLRPSSKGLDYLTVTWKVANNLFQHLSVHEHVTAEGRSYVVDQKRYADLDQLIFQHVQAIAKHVDEMCRHPKFREGTLSEVNEWLELYTRANPKNSAYVFCFDHKAPGWFLLLFKVNVNTPVTTWHVKTEADGYRLKGFLYPNMLNLCNGFKQTFKSFVSDSANRAPVSTYGGYGY